MIVELNKANLLSRVVAEGNGRVWLLVIPSDDASAIDYVVQMCWPLDRDDDLIIQSKYFYDHNMIEIYYNKWSVEDLREIANNLNTLFFDEKSNL